MGDCQQNRCWQAAVTYRTQLPVHRSCGDQSQLAAPSALNQCRLRCIKALLPAEAAIITSAFVWAAVTSVFKLSPGQMWACVDRAHQCCGSQLPAGQWLIYG